MICVTQRKRPWRPQNQTPPRQIPNPKIKISNKSQTPNHQNGKWRKTARPGGSNIPFRGIGSRIREAATKDDWQHRGRSAADSRFRLRGELGRSRRSSQQKRFPDASENLSQGSEREPLVFAIGRYGINEK